QFLTNRLVQKEPVRPIVIATVMMAGFSACAQIRDAFFVEPQTPQQAVFQAEGQYLTAKTLAARYKAQPPCAAKPATAGAIPLPSAVAPPPFCSSPSVVSAIGKTEIVVEEMLAAAERTVRDPGFKWERGAALPSGVIAAQNAVTAFANIVQSTGIR
ncbi:MAG: hypothetical protein ACT4OG_09905, partial [Alphaproteobacteria bacterium]